MTNGIGPVQDRPVRCSLGDPEVQYMVISIGDYVKNFHPKVCSSKESEHTPMPVSLEDHEEDAR